MALLFDNGFLASTLLNVLGHEGKPPPPHYEEFVSLGTMQSVQSQLIQLNYFVEIWS